MSQVRLDMENLALRNFKDFLLLYNKISESCFIHCVNQLGERDLTQDESRCIDVCIRKFVNVNHKVMQVYMEVNPEMINRKMEEMKQQQEAASKAEENNEASSSRELNLKSAVAT